MEQYKKTCCLPDVITAQMAIEYFGMSNREFDLIVRDKGLPMFRTECNRYYLTDSIVGAIREFIAESAEIGRLIPENALPAFIDTYKAAFSMTRPKERMHLRDIQSGLATFQGEFVDYAKSIIFDWQYDIDTIPKKRFLTVLQKKGWLTRTGEKHLYILEESHQE